MASIYGKNLKAPVVGFKYGHASLKNYISIKTCMFYICLIA